MKKTTRTRTITAGGTMLAAAFIAFSINQTGLTGRATGGTVGCGDIDAVGGEPFAPQRSDFEAQPVQVLDIQPTLSPDGRHIEISPFLRSAPVLASARSTEVVSPEEFRQLRNARPGTLSELLRDERLQIFNSLVDATDMRRIFDDASAEFTVFAPTDEALQAWPRFDELMAREGDAFVRAFVEHHMIAGSSMVHELPSEVVDSMAPGQSLRVDRSEYRVFSAGGSRAQVVKEGIEGERSMVHLMDGVLVPMLTSVQELEMQGDYTMFLTMLDVAGELERIGRPDRGTTILAISDSVLQELGFVASDLRSPGQAGQITNLVRNHVMSGIHTEFRSEDNDVKTDSGLFVAVAEEGFIVMSNGDEVPVQRIAEVANGVIFDARARIDYAP